jgi:hypothetical protein
MEDQELGTAQAVKPSIPIGASLADRLRRQLKIEPGQIMRISPVGKTCFRVNWYSPIKQGKDGVNLTNYHISRSGFFAVRDLGETLEIVDRTIVEPSLN